MSTNSKTTEDTLEEQSKMNQRKEQYDIIAGLGWKGFSIAFLVIIIAIVIYAVFFR
ncbi:hypothetical protein GCM10008983_17580 [Lentibacillus halophilus]|uniref:Uncharacterized protein n=1 Tax=Lentibacillus halophilus TaxID=295065 RepID=A0ABP3J6H7_9BACI